MHRKISLFVFSFVFLFLASYLSASARDYTTAQCNEVGGHTESGSSCNTGSVIGTLLDGLCQPTGVCCGPSSAASAPPTSPDCDIATVPACTSLPSGTCFTGTPPWQEASNWQKATGICPTGQSCYVPVGGECTSLGQFCITETCKSAVIGSGSCIGANAGKVCCKTVDGLAAPLLSSSDAVYTLLEPIPGSDKTVGRLKTYLEDIYRFAFWAVGIAVVFMLTIGGFMYLTAAGNTSRMETAKTVIFDAFLGLVLALVAWLFLYVINPDLVNLNLTAVSITAKPSTTPSPTIGTPTGGPTGGTTPSVSGAYTHAEALAALAAGISITSSGNCSDPNNASCTSLEGVPVSVINRVNALKGALPANCGLTITGGTETGHKTHGAGRGSIDFREDACLGNFLRDNVNNYASYGISKICATQAWQSAVRASCIESGAAAHFHIQFSV